MLSDLSGLSVVVYSNDGRPVGCGALSESLLTDSAPLREVDGSGVRGHVTLFSTVNTIYGAGTISGLEPLLISSQIGGDDCTAIDSCGSHLHAGSGCEEGQLGGHYFAEGEDDPWPAIQYTSSDDYGVAEFAFIVPTSAALTTRGLPFVVTSNEGEVAACGIV